MSNEKLLLDEIQFLFEDILQEEKERAAEASTFSMGSGLSQNSFSRLKVLHKRLKDR